jgi:peptidyl-prolyl cis-trans isomerase SurA
MAERAWEAAPPNPYSSIRMLHRITKITLLLLALIPALAGTGDRASGQELMRIAAVVNDEVISIYDLAARIDIAIVASRLRDSQELRRQVAPQVLRSLVDERLQVQEAKRLEVAVDQAELANALRLLEERNRIPTGGLEEFFQKQGLDGAVVLDQVRAEILWSKVVRRRLSASISVGEDEIDEAISRLESNRGRPEYRVSEIFLAVASADEEREVSETADRLYEQLAEGARFGQIARQFSQSATAAVGGDIGWVVGGQLPSELDVVLSQLAPKTVSRPIRAFDGYYIIALRDRRIVLSSDPLEATVKLVQLVVAPDKMEAVVSSGALDQLQSEVRGCEALLARAGEIGSELSGDLGEVAMRDLPADLGEVIAGLEVGRASAPISYEGGARVLMVCAREGGESAVPEREDIRRNIAGRRLEMLARRYLRDLRRAAFVDVRI